MQGQAVPVLQKIFLFLLLTKRVFVVKNLAFLHPLPFESSGKQLNSTTTLYASIHQKNSTNMKQLALFQMTSEAQSLAIAGQAKLEKQSNISSNITASTRFFDCVCKPSRTPRKTSISPFATYSILVSAANSNHHRPRGQRQSRPPKGQTTRQKYKY